MRSFSVLGLAAVVLPPLASATSPACAPSPYGLQLEKAVILYHVFCDELSSQGFASHQEFYSGPWASFSFTKGAASPSCDLNSCQSSYSTLMNSCELHNDTVFGGGSINAGCGTYNFTILNPDQTPAPIGNGKVTATIQAATVNTASPPSTSLSSTSQTTLPPSSSQTKATSSSTSQSSQTGSSSQLSSSASPASSPSLAVSSTTSSSTSKQTSVSLTLPPSYLNTTSTTNSISAPVNGTSSVNGSTSGVSNGSQSQTPTVIGVSPSSTKSASPVVSSNDAGAVQASGYVLLAVAVVFSFLL